MTCTVDVTTPSAREIRVTRVFDGPRTLIFECERIIHTERMDGSGEGEGGDALCTLTLAEQGGRTTLTYGMLFPTPEIPADGRRSPIQYRGPGPRRPEAPRGRACKSAQEHLPVVCGSVFSLTREPPGSSRHRRL